MKKYIILFILLTNIATIIGQTKHNVRFVIKRENIPQDQSNPYTAIIELKQENAYFKIKEKKDEKDKKDENKSFPESENISFKGGKTPKTATIFTLKFSGTLYQPQTQNDLLMKNIINLNQYIWPAIVQYIHNTDNNIPQIDITLDMFAAQNDFTRPYKELYLQVKEFCKQIDIEIAEPSMAPTSYWFQDPIGWWKSRKQQITHPFFSHWHW